MAQTCGYDSDISDPIPSPSYSIITDLDDGSPWSDFSLTEFDSEGDMSNEEISDVECDEVFQESELIMDESMPTTSITPPSPTSSVTPPSPTSSTPSSSSAQSEDVQADPILSLQSDAVPLNTPTDDMPDGFVIVGDNIDKNVRPSNQRVDRRTQSLHCFHSYASGNRIKISNFSNNCPSGEVSPKSVLPNQDDLRKILNDFETLVLR